VRGICRTLLLHALIFSVLIVTGPSPSRARAEDPCDGVLEAIQGAAFLIAGDDADAVAQIAAVASIEAARARLVPIAEGKEDYGPTAVAAAKNGLAQIDKCLAERKAADQAAGGGAAPNPPPATTPAGATAPQGGAAAGGTAANPPPIAPLSDQRPAGAGTPAAGGVASGVQAPATGLGGLLPGTSTVPLLSTDGPTVSAATSTARGLAVLGARGPSPELPPDVSFQRPGAGAFEPMGPSGDVPEDATLRVGPGTVAKLAVGGAVLQVIGDRDRGTLVTSRGEAVPVTGSDPIWGHRPPTPGEPPVPHFEVENGGLLAIWQAVTGVFTGMWLTITAPIRAGVQAGIDLAVYLRPSDSETTGALQSLTHAEPGSQVVIRPGQDGNDIYLTGKAAVTMPPPRPVVSLGEARLDAMYEAALGYPARYHTPNADVQHRETAFTLEYAADGDVERTTVTVSEGSVLLRDVVTGAERTVQAGQSDAVQSAVASAASAGGSPTAVAAAAATAASTPTATVPTSATGGASSSSGAAIAVALAAAAVLVAGGGWFMLRRRANARRS